MAEPQKSVFANMFGATTAEENDFDEAQAQRNLTQLYKIRKALESTPNDSLFGINGFGDIENVVFGAGKDPSDVSRTQRLARGIASYTSPQAVEAMAARSTLRDMAFEDTKRLLEGQGAASDFERRAAASSVNALSSQDITEDQAREETNRLVQINEFALFRNQHGIKANDDGTEYITLPDGTTQYGVTYYDQNGQRQFQTFSDPSMRAINLPQWASDETIAEGLGSIDNNAIVIYKGQPLRAGTVKQQLGVPTSGVSAAPAQAAPVPDQFAQQPAPQAAQQAPIDQTGIQ